MGNSYSCVRGLGKRYYAKVQQVNFSGRASTLWQEKDAFTVLHHDDRWSSLSRAPYSVLRPPNASGTTLVLCGASIAREAAAV